jgi:hypothetical protein
LYGCEKWSLTLREDHRLRVFENRVLRIIFGPKREEVAGGWRRLHNEELRNLYVSPNVIRVIKLRSMMGWVGHVVRIIFEWVLGKRMGKCGLEAPGSG